MINEPCVMSDDLYKAVKVYLETCYLLDTANQQEIDALKQIKSGIHALPSGANQYANMLANVDANIKEIEINNATLKELSMPYFERVWHLAEKELVGKLIYNSHYGSKVIFATQAEIHYDWIRASGKVFDLHTLTFEKTSTSSYGIFHLQNEENIKSAPWSRIIDEQYLNKMITDKINSIRMSVNSECCNLANKK